MVKITNKCLMHFDCDAMVFVLSNWHKKQLCERFSSYLFNSMFSIIIGLIGGMILMEEYVSLTTANLKLGKRHYYNDHSNGC